MKSTALLLGARHLMGVCGEQAGKFACCVLGEGTQRFAPLLCERQMAQFPLRREGWWQEEHPTLKTNAR